MDILKKKRNSLHLQDNKDTYTLNKYGTVVKNGNSMSVMNKMKQDEVKHIAIREGYYIDPRKREKQKKCVKKIK